MGENDKQKKMLNFMDYFRNLWMHFWSIIEPKNDHNNGLCRYYVYASCCRLLSHHGLLPSPEQCDR